MKIFFDKSGKFEEFCRIFHELEENDEINSIFLLACDLNGFDKTSLDPIFQKSTKCIFGGVFPSILYQGQVFDKGTIAVGFGPKAKQLTISKLSDDFVDLDAACIQSEFSLDSINFILVDGLAKRISHFLEVIVSHFGCGANFTGGGAGSLSLLPKPCLFTNQGMIMDSAIIVSMPIESSVGASHGMSMLHGPFVLTKIENCSIKSLDWKPAYQVYRNLIENYGDIDFEEGAFFDLSRQFPFGCDKMSGNTLIREAICRSEDNAIRIIGELPENSLLYIMQAKPEKMVLAAGFARAEAIRHYDSLEPYELSIVFDCIGRYLLLENQFSEEMDALHIKDISLIGVLSIGEIASGGRGYLELQNKTVTLAILGRSGGLN